MPMLNYSEMYLRIPALETNNNIIILFVNYPGPIYQSIKSLYLTIKLVLFQ